MTTPISIVLAISHTPWIEERVESLQRLLAQLDIHEHPGDRECPGGHGAVDKEYCAGASAHAARMRDLRIIADREPNHVWSERMWRSAAASSETHCLFLQDDVRVAPNFWAALDAMLEAVPDQVIGLEVVHQFAPALAEEGHRWFTTSEGLVGVGYVLPRALLVEFLEWRATALVEGWETAGPKGTTAITEDTMIGLWCLVTGRKIWHPLPTIIDHDITLKSTFGNDAHANRRPLVRWNTPEPRNETGLRYCDDQLEQAREWLPARNGGVPVPHLGRFYEPGQVAVLARTWVKGFDDAAFTSAMRDNGRKEKRRIARVKRARAAMAHVDEEARIFLATPTRGGTAPAYNLSVWSLVLAQNIEVITPFELAALEQWHEDVVRVRSRFVRTMLEETDATHLLFVDADVSFEPAAIAGMLAADADFIATPYPRRDQIHFEAVAKPDARPAEARAYGFSLRISPGQGVVLPGDVVDVDGLPLGCALLKREMLERMVTHYSDDPQLTYLDGGKPTVALFQLLVKNQALLSEDYSFCERWRAIGGKVLMYVGEGSPATHHGEHAYRGMIESFNLRRATP